MQDVLLRLHVHLRLQVFEDRHVGFSSHPAALPLDSGHQINGLLRLILTYVLLRNGVLALEQTLLNQREDAETKELQKNGDASF